ncbi:hypothetical protein GSI_10300 [Ganoderma sinense ZZ0214-1]|uniref:Uncharacterized protein n=1 Tax=Ganoderma sinense ZZ0214-1 TaxID=1077348 RepID=A0A2G8S062_9APHY|nr:hypothetical protein GSI_10300 [Ganoderma sinense ZZ0214-1]
MALTHLFADMITGSDDSSLRNVFETTLSVLNVGKTNRPRSSLSKASRLGLQQSVWEQSSQRNKTFSERLRARAGILIQRRIEKKGVLQML